MDDRTLGMFFTRQAVPGSGTVFGAGVAARELIQAVLTHAPAQTCRLFVPPDAVKLASRELSTLCPPRSRRARAEVYGHEGLLDRSAGGGVDVWHDVDSDVVRPFHLRSLLPGARFPITVTHHTFSAQGLLHDWFLPLLVGDVRATDAVICTSTAAREALRRLLDGVAERFNASQGTRLRFRGRLEVIPLGVDTERFKPRPKAATRRKLELPTDALVLLWMGRLSAADKADLLPLVRVFATLKARHPGRKLKLVIAGSPVRGEHVILQEYARALGLGKDVLVRGDCPPAQRHLLHAAADVFVSPVDSVQETFGLTPIEALACGTPQVVSDWNGYRDTVVEGETGFRVKSWLAEGSDADLGPEAALREWDGLHDQFALAQATVVDPEGLLGALDRLVGDAALRERMSEASRRRAVERYSWEVVMRQHAALWEALVEKAVAVEPSPSYRQMPYVEAFRGYASEVLGGQARLAVTESGRAVLQGEEGLPAYYEHLGAVDDSLLERSLALVGEAGEAGMSLEEVARALGGEDVRGRARALRGAMWLLKYGFAVRRG